MSIRTLHVLWRTSGFLSGLAVEIEKLAPDKARIIRDFQASLEDEARLLSERTVAAKEIPQ